MIQLPIPSKALEDCGAVLGRRGAGKSGTGRAILEHELDAGHRCCAIDPKGDWWGIRANKDGSPSRFEIPVFGGAHADIPIDDSMGHQIASIVANSASSYVVDLSGFSRNGMLKFMRAFAETLFAENRQPLTLFVDEADQLAPQRVSAEMALLLHHMEALIRQGRQRGIFMWMLTQRPAVINKNLLSQAETLIAMKMTGPHDRKAIREWMDAHDPEKAAEVEAKLSKLSVGEAFAWVPGADFLKRVQFPLYDSYDSGRTPLHGEKVGDVELKKLDVSELAKLLHPAEADVEPDELEMLREENQRLRDQNRRVIEARERTEAERDHVIELLSRVQDTIGMAIGSPRIHPVPAGTDPEDVVMVVDAAGEVRPYTRHGQLLERVRNGRRQLAKALPPEGPPAPAELPAPAEKVPPNWLEFGQRIFELRANKQHVAAFRALQPAQRKIIFAIAAATGQALARHEIADIAGVSLRSSNMNTKLDRLVDTGIVEHDNNDNFRLAI